MHRGAASERGDVVILALFALAAFDAIAVASARFSITDDANAAAEVANSTWNQMNGNVQAAYDAAAGYADQHNETIVRGSFSVAPTGAVHLTLHGHATTLVMSHLGPLKKLVDTTGKGSATTPSN